MKMKYTPKYNLTNKILNDIASIERSKALILSSQLQPRWMVKLKKEAIINRAHHSTAIEGNILTKEEVTKLYEGKSIQSKKEAVKEVKNYFKALKYIEAVAKKSLVINEKEIKKIHLILTKSLLKTSESGKYRKRYVVVETDTGKIIHKPPKNKEIPVLIKEFIKFLKSKKAEEIHPVILSGIAHLFVAWIHPFVDGNGRTARALATLILYSKGFDTQHIFSIDDFFNEDRPGYYKSFDKIRKTYPKATKWIEYYVEAVAVSLAKVKRRITELGISKFKKEKISINERQEKLLIFMKNNPKIQLHHYKQICTAVDERTLRRDLSDLVKKGVLKRTGDRKGARYNIKDRI